MARLITLTVNPALDIACSANKVVHTHKVRTGDDHLDPGGGGINVARVLHELGAETLAVIMTGGVTGALVEEMLDGAGVPRHSVRIDGRTRISFNVFDRESKLEYRFVENGPDISAEDWHRILHVLAHLEGDWIVASGSLEHGMPEDIYARVALAAHRRGQRFALDCSGTPLRLALQSHNKVELVKPSLRELEELVGRGPLGPQEQEEEAIRLVREGAARLVAVTLGEGGAFVASSEGVIRQNAVSCAVRSAVGAGDSFTAAMVLALSRDEPPEDALRWGVAAGTAAVMCAGTARIMKADVEAQYRLLRETMPGIRS